MAAADPVTHVKVVAVALTAAILVITVGLFANGSALEKGGPFAVIKASNLIIHANSGYVGRALIIEL